MNTIFTAPFRAAAFVLGLAAYLVLLPVAMFVVLKSGTPNLAE